MELIKFIFSSFWIFFGNLILVGVILEGIAEIIKAFRKPNSKEELENND